MNNLQSIMDRIASDAEDYAALTVSEAKKQAADILDTYKSEADYKASVIGDKSKKEAAEKNSRLESAAKMRERNKLLETKARLVSECFDAAAEKINSLPENEYLAYLVGLFFEAYENKAGLVLMNARDKAAVGEKFVSVANEILAKNGVVEKVTLDGNTCDIDGGFILVYGDVETNCSTKIVVSQQRKSLENEVLKMLFPDA